MCLARVGKNENYLKSKIQSSLHRVFMPKRVTSGGAHLRGLAPARQRSFKETSQRWRFVGDTVSDLTCPGIAPKTSRTGSNVFKHYPKIISNSLSSQHVTLSCYYLFLSKVRRLKTIVKDSVITYDREF